MDGMRMTHKALPDRHASRSQALGRLANCRAHTPSGHDRFQTITGMSRAPMPHKYWSSNVRVEAEAKQAASMKTKRAERAALCALSAHLTHLALPRGVFDNLPQVVLS